MSCDGTIPISWRLWTARATPCFTSSARRIMHGCVSCQMILQIKESSLLHYCVNLPLRADQEERRGYDVRVQEVSNLASLRSPHRHAQYRNLSYLRVQVQTTGVRVRGDEPTGH